MFSKRPVVLKYASAVLVALALSLSCEAQEQEKQEKTEYREIETVTIDLSKFELSWTVAKGEDKDGKFVPTPGSEKTYKTDFRRARITSGDKTYSLSPEDAKDIRQIILALIYHVAGSVEWFEQQEQQQEQEEKNKKPPKDKAQNKGPEQSLLKLTELFEK